MIDATLPLAFQPVFIQCTWANCYSEPVRDRGLCVQSYDRDVLYRAWMQCGFINEDVAKKTIGLNIKVRNNQIGILTGQTKTIEGREWVEVYLFYSNRRDYGWMRKSDIWYPLKGTDQNKSDGTGLIEIDPVNPEKFEPTAEEKKSPLSWIVAAISVLSILK